MKTKISSKAFWTLSVTLIIILSVFFIFQINFITAETRLIQLYEERLETANQENETLIVNSFRVNSLENISELAETFGFEKIEKIYYIREPLFVEMGR